VDQEIGKRKTFKELGMNGEEKLRYEINFCGGCEVCRDLLESNCLAIPEIFRLYDKEKETGEKITTDELRHLVDLCNFCAVCPCRNIREALLHAKADFIQRYGLSFKIKAIENVDRVGRWGGTLPGLTNFVLQNETTRAWIEKILGLHRARKFPAIPHENFPRWFSTRDEKAKPALEKKRKVAYFTGCTAKYFFPDVAKAFMEVFERNHIEIYCHDQTCCGMPAFLEGDMKLAGEYVQYNLPRLLKVIEDGYDVVCSCPTCGYMLKCILSAGAYFSPEFIATLPRTKEGFIKIPWGGSHLAENFKGYQLAEAEFAEEHLRDDGYFSFLNPLHRIKVAENTYDAGEYLLKLHAAGELDTQFGPVQGRVAYYPPCHMREQKMGRPYYDLLGLIPGVSSEAIDAIYCCGNAGIMGYKEYFHPLSIRIASKLIGRMKDIHPDVIATDCLSCRLQFNQTTTYKVTHPLEIIMESYENYQAEADKKAV
jgi:glycerol-3-phosphate dehydrogenase subunit C